MVVHVQEEAAFFLARKLKGETGPGPIAPFRTVSQKGQLTSIRPYFLKIPRPSQESSRQVASPLAPGPLEGISRHTGQ